MSVLYQNLKQRRDQFYHEGQFLVKETLPAQTEKIKTLTVQLAMQERKLEELARETRRDAELAEEAENSNTEYETMLTGYGDARRRVITQLREHLTMLDPSETRLDAEVQVLRQDVEAKSREIKLLQATSGVDLVDLTEQVDALRQVAAQANDKAAAEIADLTTRLEEATQLNIAFRSSQYVSSKMPDQAGAEYWTSEVDNGGELRIVRPPRSSVGQEVVVFRKGSVTLQQMGELEVAINARSMRLYLTLFNGAMDWKVVEDSGVEAYIWQTFPARVSDVLQQSALELQGSNDPATRSRIATAQTPTWSKSSDSHVATFR